MAATTASVIMGVLGLGMNVAGGAMQGQAARRQYDEQATIVEQDSLREIERIKIEGEEFREHQTLAFLKSGVEIDGSPLMVLKESAKRQGEAVGEVRRSTMQQARALRNQGRAAQRQALFSGLGSGVGGIMNIMRGAI